MKLLIKKLNTQATIPSHAHDDDACFDLTTTSCDSAGSRSRIYGTGLSMDIPKGYLVEVYIRSSLAFKGDFILTNGVGIIDAGYIGEVKCKLTYIGDGKPDWPWVGDRIAQARLVRKIKTEIEETYDIKDTERGDGGFGSSGK